MLMLEQAWGEGGFFRRGPIELVAPRLDEFDVHCLGR